MGLLFLLQRKKTEIGEEEDKRVAGERKKKRFDIDTTKIQLKSNLSPTWQRSLLHGIKKKNPLSPKSIVFFPRSPSRDYPLSPPALTPSLPTSSSATGSIGPLLSLPRVFQALAAVSTALGSKLSLLIEHEFLSFPLPEQHSSADASPATSSLQIVLIQFQWQNLRRT
jgi:hypothetical protein